MARDIVEARKQIPIQLPERKSAPLSKRFKRLQQPDFLEMAIAAAEFIGIRLKEHRERLMGRIKGVSVLVGIVSILLFDLLGAYSAFAARHPGFGIMGVPLNPRSGPALRDLGVGWVRFTIRLGERRQNLKAVVKHGYRMWMTISHRDLGNIVEEGTVGFARAHRGGFPPRDGRRFRNLIAQTVQEVVEELHAAGRKPSNWLVVQFENEVLPRDLRPPDQPQRFWHGTGEEYLKALSICYDAVKSVDPTVPVALMGFSSEEDTSPLIRRPA